MLCVLHTKTAENICTYGLPTGDTYQGGIIVYLDPSGCHGLIAAASDQSTGVRIIDLTLMLELMKADCLKENITLK